MIGSLLSVPGIGFTSKSETDRRYSRKFAEYTISVPSGEIAMSEFLPLEKVCPAGRTIEKRMMDAEPLDGLSAHTNAPAAAALSKTAVAIRSV